MVSIKIYVPGYRQLQSLDEPLPDSIDTLEKWEEYKQMRIEEFIEDFHFKGTSKDNRYNRLKNQVGSNKEAKIKRVLVVDNEDEAIENIKKRTYSDDIKRLRQEINRIQEARESGRIRRATFKASFFEDTEPDIPDGISTAKRGDIVILEGEV